MIKLGKIVNKATFIVSLVSYAGVVAIMLLNVTDVLLTKLATKPISGAYEITESLLLCTVFASFAYAQSKKAHINMTILINVFPRVLKFLIYGLMGLLSAAVAAVVGYAAVLQAASAIDKGTVTSVLMLPMYPLYYVEAAAMFIFALSLLYDAALSFAAVFSKKHAELVTSSWTL
jgi:TRAP-type C4-dicarboxylate transport system permease small subunit